MKTKINNHEPKGYQLNWSTLRREWPIWLLLIGTLIAGIIIYPSLPDQVPSHWNFKGEVDAHSSREFGAFMLPLINIGMYLMMLFLPLIDPKRDNYARFAGAYRFLRCALAIFMTAIYAITILSALGYQINTGLVVKAFVALLFMLIGNFMGQMRHNYFVGIKNPWTLANEEVWQATHRFSGKLWVIGGLITLLLAPVQALWGVYLFFTVIVILVVLPMVYSYLLFRRLS
ncbi:MAG: SdpI family protein [Syntrophomonadaceae bacterium]|nr:SdpI family protein [Syntrophomonadaceae bacterium]